MSDKYDPEEIRKNLEGVMECHLEWEAGPDTALNMLQLVPSLYAVSKKDALILYENIQQMGKYMAQMGQLIGQMQRRMDDLEARQAAVTVRHADVKRLNQLIRIRADEICGKYGLEDPESPKRFRAAIKKDLQRRYGVKDLHDLPEASLAGAENMIGRWVNTRMAMERRGMYGRV